MVLQRWKAAFLPSRIRSYFRFMEASTENREIQCDWTPGNERVLVLAPHSDDEVLGPGGTAALHALAGAHVIAAIVNDGRGSGPDGMDDAMLVSERENEARNAGKIIGFSDHAFARIPDRSQHSWGQGRAWLRSLLDAHQPEFVYAPSPIDEHADHVFTVRLLAAELEANAGSVREVSCYEVWTPLVPNRVVDISSVAEQKRRAIQSYPTQTARSNIEGALMGLGAFRAHRHLGASTTCAEAFWTTDPQAFVRVSHEV